jgi:hypothetical protein
MTTFDVFVHQGEGYEAVKRGFSWPAFLFGVFWAFYKKLWLHGSVYLALMLAVALSGGGAEGDGLVALYDLIGFAISLFVGATGNGWRRQALLAQGYRHIDRVVAPGPEEAIQGLFRREESFPV